MDHWRISQFYCMLFMSLSLKPAEICQSKSYTLFWILCHLHSHRLFGICNPSHCENRWFPPLCGTESLCYPRTQTLTIFHSHSYRIPWTLYSLSCWPPLHSFIFIIFKIFSYPKLSNPIISLSLLFLIYCCLHIILP